MNISHLEYIKTIVEEDFNLTIASAKLHVSQPALSNLISRLEKTMEVQLFIRSNGRLVGLSNAGEILYSYASVITNIYTSMVKEIKNLTEFHGGSISIGIPPLILSVLFTEVLSSLFAQNPNIKFNIIEEGAFQLSKTLEDLDISIMIQPNEVNLKYYNEVILLEDELYAFMSKSHSLSVKEEIEWKDIGEYNIATFDESFMIRHHLQNKLEQHNIFPRISTETSSWDFLISIVRDTNLITILPRPIESNVDFSSVESIKIKDPIPWIVTMIYPKKDRYSTLEKYVIKSIEDYFVHNKAIDSYENFKYLENL